jgi:N-acetylglucosaminyldiphosphoundecaprenol N-acetyl-beta-D-mannosaminyltransferase
VTPTQAELLGVKVQGYSVDELLRAIGLIIDNGEHEVVLNVNAHALNLASKSAWLRDFLNQAFIVFPDGAGVVMAARIKRQYLPRRITYADWIWQLCAFAEGRGDSLYFLGALPGVAERAAQNLRKKYPILQIVGVRDGYFDHTMNCEQNNSVIRDINTASPNILILGMGMPLQEHWLMENWKTINANVFLTGGAVFDYASGRTRRAPKWMIDHGLEWLGRLIIEPGRLWQRYIFGIPKFIYLVLRESLQERFRRKRGQ